MTDGAKHHANAASRDRRLRLVGAVALLSLLAGAAQATERPDANVVTAHARKLMLAFWSKGDRSGLLEDFAPDARLCLLPAPGARSVQCDKGAAAVAAFYEGMFANVAELQSLSCKQLDPDLYACTMVATHATSTPAAYAWGYRFAGDRITELRLLPKPTITQ